MRSNIDDRRIEKGVQYIVVGFFYIACAMVSFFTNIIINDLYYFSLLMLYSASAGNLLVGIAITSKGFIRLKKEPLKDETWYKLGLALMGCCCILFFYGILSAIGFEFEFSLMHLIVNGVFIILILPIFICAFIFFFSGLRLYRKYRKTVQ